MNQHKKFLEQANKLIVEDRGNKLVQILFNYPYPQQLSKVQDNEGQSILFKLAAVKDQKLSIKACEYMINYGCDPKKKDKLLQTVFYYAARYQNLQLVKYLFKFGINFKQVDNYGQTPLFYCGRYNQKPHISQFLINNNCDLNHKDFLGQTCLFYAAGYGKLQICKLLIKSGINPSISDNNREKAINYARRNGHLEVVNYLNNYKSAIRIQPKIQHKIQPKQVKIQTKEIKQNKPKQVKIQKNQIIPYMQSSQNTNQKKRKKQMTKNQYYLVYTDENGNSKTLNLQQLQQFRNSSQDHQKIYKMLTSPQQLVEWTTPLADRKFQKTAIKILAHFQKDINGYYFIQPVNYVALKILDYPDIIKNPMDFGTIKKKLTMNVYDNQLQFQGDMNLVFDNCILYNGTQKQIGKIALQMRAEFNAMFIRQFA